MNAKDREDFEVAMRSSHGWEDYYFTIDTYTGQYNVTKTVGAYKGWQAAREPQQQLKDALNAAEKELSMWTLKDDARRPENTLYQVRAALAAAKPSQPEKILETVKAFRAEAAKVQGHLDAVTEAAQVVHEEWQLVPVDPTDEMKDKARSLSSFPEGVYRAMISCAPAYPFAPINIISNNELMDIFNNEEFCLYCDPDEFVEIAHAVLAAAPQPPAVPQSKQTANCLNCSGGEVKEPLKELSESVLRKICEANQNRKCPYVNFELLRDVIKADRKLNGRGD